MPPPVPKNSRGFEMHGNGRNLHERKLVVMFFAFVSGVSVVATAVLPAIVHA
jgi:hypothetical protein